MRTPEQFEIEFVRKCDNEHALGIPTKFSSMYSLIEAASLIAEITDKNIYRVFDNWEIDYHPVVNGKFLVKIHPANSEASFTITGINNQFILNNGEQE
jgi:hypothetical protein